jgi:hypothetical protein
MHSVSARNALHLLPLLIPFTVGGVEPGPSSFPEKLANFCCFEPFFIGSPYPTMQPAADSAHHIPECDHIPSFVLHEPLEISHIRLKIAY